MLCLTKVDKLAVKCLPSQFQTIHRLERALVSSRILFKKVIIIPKGQSPKLKRSICSIPISEVGRNCMSLPRPTDSNSLILFNLKHKAGYHSHILFEPVRPSFVGSFLRFLKQFNHLYSDIEIDLDNTSKN